MKTIKYLFFVALGSVLMAADCSNKDSEFYNDVYLSVPELIAVETRNVYFVDDVIYLNSDNFSRYLDEPNQPNPLDVFKTTGGTTSFSFTYMLEKKVGTDLWELVSLGSNLLKERGNAQETDLYVEATCIYNDNTEAYEFRNGLRLAQAGEYRINFGYNSASTTGVDLRSNSFNNNLFVNINSSVPSLDSAGNYNFTVTD